MQPTTRSTYNDNQKIAIAAASAAAFNLAFTWSFANAALTGASTAATAFYFLNPERAQGILDYVASQATVTAKSGVTVMQSFFAKPPVNTKKNDDAVTTEDYQAALNSLRQ